MELQTYIADQIQAGLERYRKDFLALSQESRLLSPGGVARSAYDMTYELVLVTDWMSRVILGENEPGPNRDGWVHAPESFCSETEAMASLGRAVEAFLTVWNRLGESELSLEILGGRMSALELGTIMNRHLGYHDAQLNYLQSIVGDTDIHW